MSYLITLVSLCLMFSCAPKSKKVKNSSQGVAVSTLTNPTPTPNNTATPTPTATSGSPLCPSNSSYLGDYYNKPVCFQSGGGGTSCAGIIWNNNYCLYDFNTYYIANTYSSGSGGTGGTGGLGTTSGDGCPAGYNNVGNYTRKVMCDDGQTYAHNNCATTLYQNRCLLDQGSWYLARVMPSGGGSGGTGGTPTNANEAVQFSQYTGVQSVDGQNNCAHQAFSFIPSSMNISSTAFGSSTCSSTSITCGKTYRSPHLDWVAIPAHNSSNARALFIVDKYGLVSGSVFEACSQVSNLPSPVMIYYLWEGEDFYKIDYPNGGDVTIKERLKVIMKNSSGVEVASILYDISEVGGVDYVPLREDCPNLGQRLGFHQRKPACKAVPHFTISESTCLNDGRTIWNDDNDKRWCLKNKTIYNGNWWSAREIK